jgi:hypothetical protein
LLSGTRFGRRWQDKGWKILERGMPNQFHADGGTVEQATGYHHFTLGFYVQAVLLRRRLGLPVQPHVWSLLERVFEFSMMMTRPDGTFPMIGDGDEGKAVDLEQDSIWDFRSWLAIGAVLFERGDFKDVAGPFPPDAAWLVGVPGWQTYHQLKSIKPAVNSKWLRQSGYCVMRTGWDRESHYLAFDCGEIAAGVPAEDISSSAHGHADALAIEVASYGTPILVDPGFYTYNGDEAWHRYFRETRAHNTAVIDGCSQAEYRGRLKWSRAPRVHLHHWVSTNVMDYAEASHEGYHRLREPVTHRRAVVFLKPNYWIVRDEFWGEGEHQIELYYHFAGVEIDSSRGDKTIYARTSLGKGLALIPLEEALAAEITQGRKGPEGGWLAVGYGKKLPVPVVRYSITATLPIALHTLLVPFRTDVPDLEIESLQFSPNASLLDDGFIIADGRSRDILLFSASHDQAGEVCAGGLRTDGRFGWVRLNADGEVTSCGLVAGSVLASAGSILLQARAKVAFVNFHLDDGRATVEKPDLAEISTAFDKYDRNHDIRLI